jgi:hypothetical protein
MHVPSLGIDYSPDYGLVIPKYGRCRRHGHAKDVARTVIVGVAAVTAVPSGTIVIVGLLGVLRLVIIRHIV